MRAMQKPFSVFSEAPETGASKPHPVETLRDMYVYIIRLPVVSHSFLCFPLLTLYSPVFTASPSSPPPRSRPAFVQAELRLGRKPSRDRGPALGLGDRVAQRVSPASVPVPQTALVAAAAAAALSGSPFAVSTAAV